MTPHKQTTISAIDAYQRSLTYRFWSADKVAMTVLARADIWGWQGLPAHRVICTLKSSLKPMPSLDLFHHWKHMTIAGETRRDFGPVFTQAMKVAA